MTEAYRGSDLVTKIVESYPGAVVRVGGFPRPIPVESAVAMEREMCPERATGSPVERASHLLGLLAAAGTPILPEHRVLLQAQPE